MKKLYIIGARGFGREVYELIQHTVAYKRGEYKIVGYLDDKSNALDGYKDYPPIIDSVENFQPKPEDVFVCALGTPQTKKTYAEKIQAKGGEFINLIHENAELGIKIENQKGLIIFSNTFVSVDVTLGDFITIQQFSFLGHDAKVGSWGHINTFCSINGFVKIGDSVQIYTHASILPKFEVGDSAIVGAGSLVMKNVNPNVTVFGSPARELKTP
jgi:sugar O-acyltransferase (sialic acid O-acetyltransferase NeuD family)